MEEIDNTPISYSEELLVSSPEKQIEVIETDLFDLYENMQKCATADVAVTTEEDVKELVLEESDVPSNEVTAIPTPSAAVSSLPMLETCTREGADTFEEITNEVPATAVEIVTEAIPAAEVAVTTYPEEKDVKELVLEESDVPSNEVTAIPAPSAAVSSLPMLEIPPIDFDDQSSVSVALDSDATPIATTTDTAAMTTSAIAVAKAAPSAVEHDAMDAALSRSIRKTNASTVKRSSSSVRGVSPRLIANTRASSARCRQRYTPAPAPAAAARRTSAPTIPTAPCFRTSHSRALPVSSEEQLLQTIQAETAAEAQRRATYSKFYAATTATPAATTTVRSTKPLTIPETPNSKLTQRLGERAYATTTSAKPVTTTTAATTTHSGPTIPKPFHFATDARVSASTTPCTATPTTAELMQQFTTKTRGPITTTSAPLTATIPTAPKFAAHRSKPLPQSQAEKEAQEVAEAQSYHFKATPVNPRIYGRSCSSSSISSGGVIGVPRVAAKPTTTPTPFALATDSRAAAYKPASSVTETAPAPFKALPLPSTTATPAPTAAVAPKPLTQPLSPKLNGGVRASSAPARRQLPHHSTKSVATAVVPDKPLTLTQPIEFTLQTSLRSRPSVAPEPEPVAFHALPLPAATCPFRPTLDGGHLTEVQEFHLSTPKLRSTSKSEEEFIFHAKPLPSSTFQPPPTIAKPHREPLVCQDVNLSTDARLEKRREYDAKNNARLAAEASMKLQREQEAALKEQEELKRLRQLPVSEGGMKFKAAPVLSSDPYPTHAVAPRPLTEPISPPLQTKLRTRIM